MIKHIVLWTLKEDTPFGKKEEAKMLLRGKLLALKDTITEIRAIDVKFNISENAQDNFDICLSAEFDSYQDLDIYQKHEEHLKVVEIVKQLRIDRACIDYEI